MEKLDKAIANLLAWQKAEKSAGRSTDKRCLEAIRRALFKEALLLPLSGVDYASKLAIDNFKALAANPGKWGWRVVHHPLPTVCLVYYKRCGKLKNGTIAGHIGILKGGVIYANKQYNDSKWWGARIVGAFAPVPNL